jgi:hypothetical protein
MMKMVVPIGGNETLLLGWPPTACLGDELEEVAWACADVADDDVDHVPGVAAPVAAPVVHVEPDDPPHAVSSRSSEPSPAATVHLLLRITSALPEDLGPYAVGRDLTYPT